MVSRKRKSIITLTKNSSDIIARQGGNLKTFFIKVMTDMAAIYASNSGERMADLVNALDGFVHTHENLSIG